MLGKTFKGLTNEDIKIDYCPPRVLSKTNLPKFPLRHASGLLYSEGAAASDGQQTTSYHVKNFLLYG